MPPSKFEFVGCRSQLYRDDLATLRNRGLALPHIYASWPTHDSHSDWLWCRVLDSARRLHTGFALELTPSRALPGTRIGRIERLGRLLHAGVDDLGSIIAQVAISVPRLQRLDVQVFDEDAPRRDALAAQLTAAGARQVVSQRSYRRTPVLALGDSPSELFARLSPRARRSLRRFDASGRAIIAQVDDPRYVPRMQQLYRETFDRTDSDAPAVDFSDIQSDASDGRESLLAGVFWPTRQSTRDLVAVFWGRLQGDHVSYDIGATERADDLGQVPLGYPLMFHLANWARDRGARWLDMGGITPPDSPPGHRLQGIADFKRTFTTDEREVAAEFSFEPRPMLSALADTLRGARRLLHRRHMP